MFSKKNLPMLITYSRILIVPFIIGLLYLYPDRSQIGWVCVALFILAAFTDWLDGYLARQFSTESSMGKLMDPIADKLLVLCVLVMLLHLERIGPWLVILLIARDIFINGLRSVSAAENIIISAKLLGKWKTLTQMIGLPLLFVPLESMGWSSYQLGVILLWVSVGLSYVSAIEYVWVYMKNSSPD